VADAAVRPQAHLVAITIANEWLNRPWPYEITPPNLPVPPFRGLGRDDRQRYFSVIAAARQTDATAPRLLLPLIFGADTTKLVAYGQAEAFNWNEFNDTWGGDERVDQTNFTPWGGVFVCSPRAWRTATIGGWNWRSRLSLSDALAPALDSNEELLEYLHDAGISSPNEASLNEVNLH
jgi:hypothetical protein